MLALVVPPWTVLGTLAVLLFMLLCLSTRNLNHRDANVVLVLASDDQGRIGGFPDFKHNTFCNHASYCYRHGYDFVWANISAFPVPHAPTPHWSKAPIIRAAFDAFPHAEWVWWLDLDTIIMTPSLPLSSFLAPNTLHTILLPPGSKIVGSGGITDFNITYPTRRVNGWDRSERLEEDKIHLLITQDEYFGINTGSFFIRRGVWADWVLDMWTDEDFIAHMYVFQEQDALLHMMLRHEIVRNGVGIARQRAINAYPRGKDDDQALPDEHAKLELERKGLGMKWAKGDLLVHMAGCATGGWCAAVFQEMWEKREPERHGDVLGAEKKRLRGEWAIQGGAV